jgi:hypothetical protein
MAIRSGTVDAAEDLSFFFNAVTDDPAIAMRAGWSQGMDRAFETIKDMRLAVHPHLEAFVVVVSAEFAFGHT